MRSAAAAYLRWRVTVEASVASTVSSGSQMKGAPAWSAAASKERLTASAANGSPSWKVAPERSLNVQVRPSALVDHEVARPGLNWSAAPGGFTHRSGS